MGKVRIPAVTLRRHPLHWRRVPGHLKLRILDGVERITEIHAGLAEALQVTSLPPVVVHDALWWEPGVTIIVSGRAGPIPIAPPASVFGVELPVHVALSDAANGIRRVLLHEFGHCFFHDALIIDTADAGRTVIDGGRGPRQNVYTDEAGDRAALVDPAEWFIGDAVTDFPYWGDAGIQGLADSVGQWIGMFRADPPVVGYTVHQFAIPDDIVTHVHRLRERRQGKPSSPPGTDRRASLSARQSVHSGRSPVRDSKGTAYARRVDRYGDLAE